MAKPTLALIPAAQGDKFYSVLPSNGIGDFSFSRIGEATRINKDGLIETVANGVSRLNYSLIDGVVSGCPSYLLEPNRTNLFQYSNDFSQSYWTKDGSSVLSGFISPDGTTNAFKLVENVSNSLHRVGRATFSANVNRTLSFFAKKGERNYISLFENNVGSPTVKGVIFDLENGTFYNNNEGFYFNVQIENYGNGWYRCSAYFQNGGLSVPSIGISADGLTNSYQGDGTSGVYIFGAQLEEGLYTTSIMPSNGTAETRSAETANGAGDINTFNDSEGVLYAEIKAFTSQDTVEPNRYITLTNGTSNERIALLLGGNPNQLRAIIYSASQNINLSFSTTLTDVKQFNKLALKYKRGDHSFFLNGVKIGGSTLDKIFSENTFNNLSFDVGGGPLPFRGIVKDMRVYNTGLTDQELEALTQV